MTNRGRLVVGIGCSVFACALLASACGGDDDAGGSSSGTSGTSGTSGASGSSGDAAIDAPDGAPAPCSRAAEARTAPASLYDAFKADMVALTGAARAARVDTFLAAVAAQGGTPLEDRKTGRAIFLANGAPPNGAWKIVGSFNAWDPATALATTQVADTDLWVLDTTTLPAATSQSYQLLSGTDDTGFVEDPLANNVTWDGVVRGGPDDFNVGRFHAIVHPQSIPSAKGRLVRHGSVAATMLANSRRVFVYFPAKYDDGTCGDLPSILFNDGNEALTRGDYAGAADTLYATTPALSAVIVFAELASADLNQRVEEYSFNGASKGVQYVDFLASDLWPSVKTRYRLCSKQEARGVAGASLGGLIASFGAFEKPAEWGWVGSQSGSYWWSGNALITRAQSTAKIPVRFYLDSTCPNDNCGDVSSFASALQGKGYDYTRVTNNMPVQPTDPHDWANFKTRAPQLLTHFRSGITACN